MPRHCHGLPSRFLAFSRDGGWVECCEDRLDKKQDYSISTTVSINNDSLGMFTIITSQQGATPNLSPGHKSASVDGMRVL